MSAVTHQKFNAPRFYCDYGNFVQASGQKHSDYITGNEVSLVNIDTGEELPQNELSELGISNSNAYKITSLTPTIPTLFKVQDRSEALRFKFWTLSENESFFMVNYIAILCHNLKNAEAYAVAYIENDEGQQLLISNPIINSSLLPTEIFRGSENDNGTTICDLYGSQDWSTDSGEGTTSSSSNANGKIGFEDKTTYERFALSGNTLVIEIRPLYSTFLRDITIGSISYGRYIDMPYSPDVNITEEISYEGVDRAKTLGGANVSNIKYTGSPKWNYDISMNEFIEPFSCSRRKDILRNGRRSWDLEYSSLFNYHLQSPNLDLSDSFQSNDLYNQLILKTLNGQLPFILETSTETYTFTDQNNYDNKDFNVVKYNEHMPQNFFISRLEDNTYSQERIQGNLYSTSMKIVESW